MINNYFTYNNGHDESTYLSYQGALVNLDRPGYFACAYVVYTLHHLGVSGAIQNLLFDIIIPIGLFVMLLKIAEYFYIPKNLSILFALLLLIGNILFNSVNPFVDFMGKFNSAHFLIGVGPWPALFRTPNPQVSYFLVCLFVLLRIHFKRNLFLFLPIPILYYSVVIPYCFFLSVYFVVKVFKKISLFRFAMTACFVGVIMCFLLRVLMQLYLGYDESLVGSILVARLSTFLVTPSLLGALGLYGVFLFMSCFRSKLEPRYFHYVFISGIVCVLFLGNQHLISGFRLAPNNFEEYSSPFISTFLLIALIWFLANEFLTEGKLRIVVVLFWVVCIACVFDAHRFDWRELRFKIYTYYGISDGYIERIVRDPAHAIISYPPLASRMALIAPRIIAPPFSHHYRISTVRRMCPDYVGIHEGAFEHVARKRDSEAIFARFFNDIEYSYMEFKRGSSEDRPQDFEVVKSVCDINDVSWDSFFVVPFTDRKSWISFPSFEFARMVFSFD